MRVYCLCKVICVLYRKQNNKGVNESKRCKMLLKMSFGLINIYTNVYIFIYIYIDILIILLDWKCTLFAK